MRKDKAPHILLTGGGTLGPVTPLLAIRDEWRKRVSEVKISWIGTPTGPEKSFLSGDHAMTFYSLFAPKLSRHQKWKWPFLPFLFLASVAWAFILLRKLRPDILYTAGGYVSVPLFLVARVMGIPTWVHQLDVEPGLANKIMVRLASRISTTFEESAALLGGVCVGGMIRQMDGDATRALEKFDLDPAKPTVFLMGGGTGAMQLNDALLAITPDLLPQVNIIHSFGKGKKPANANSKYGYFATELLVSDLADAYAVCDILIARGGLGTLLEAVAWQKPVIMVPIEGSHQEKNAQIVEESGAGVILRRMNPQMLLRAIEKMVQNRFEREAMARSMGALVSIGAEKEIVEESINLLEL
jgi:UDP-N-acetylglucosamine--N-acetylmuramyl-(pentapeptide) pyrophosphoryl-undecaprenol N-acetylglucosamine transferase